MYTEALKIVMKVVSGFGALGLGGAVAGSAWLITHPEIAQELFGPSHPRRKATYLLVTALSGLLLAALTLLKG